VNENEDVLLAGTLGLPGGDLIYVPFNAASDTTRALDRKRSMPNDLNLKPGDVPEGALIAHNDNDRKTGKLLGQDGE
jgi:hypothetical protein